jgi:ParB family chromosome partitioning protein
MKNMRLIPLESIDLPAAEIRSATTQEGLEELARSIKLLGLINPITVRAKDDGRWEVVAGVRRFLACKMIGAEKVRCIEVSKSDPEPDSYKIHENLFREEVNPLDYALFLTRLRRENNYTVQDLARITGRSTGWVSQTLSLAELPEDCKALIESGKATWQTARELAKIEDPEDRFLRTKWAVDSGANDQTVRNWVREYQAAQERTSTLQHGTPSRSEIPESPVNLFQCSVCNKRQPVDRMHLIRVDPDCFTIAREVFAEIRRMDRDGDQRVEDPRSDHPSED